MKVKSNYNRRRRSRSVKKTIIRRKSRRRSRSSRRGSRRFRTISRRSSRRSKKKDGLSGLSDITKILTYDPTIKDFTDLMKKFFSSWSSF